MITQELLNELFEYKDGNLYWKNHKYKLLNGKKAGSIQGNGYIRVRIFGNPYKAHRLIFLMKYGYLPKEVDHINNNRSDNRIENLRAATKSQNRQNSLISKSNKSGVKGVCWDKTNNKWKVTMFVNNKQKYFGHYNDIDYAKFVADAMRYKYHKEFSNTGEINGSIR